MIAKGNFHSGGVKLATYLVKGHPGERGELVDMRGFGAVSDLRQGFRDEQIKARDGTKAEAPFFHVQFRAAPGEGHLKLSRANWAEIADRCDRALGPVMSEQPRAVSLHINRKTGDMHLHIGYSLVRETEDGRLHVQKLGLYKNKLKHLARELERDYGLTIVSNERQPHDRARAAGRNELEESRRLGTNVREIRTAILDSLERSDGGKAFKAALEGRGFVLANADRRDCLIVIDEAGGLHPVNKKLSGLTLAETRARLGDLDRSQLPSVEQAKAMQAERQAAREAQEREKHGRGADGQGRDERPASDPQRGPQPEIKPLGQTAGEIRLAWQTTKTGPQFAQAIEDRGLIPVHVSREEAEDSWRAAAFHKAIGRQSRALKEGFAVVDERGNVTRIDQRTTGDLWEEIQKKLGGIDKDKLHSVAKAWEIMADRRRAAWIDEQDKARPASAIERAILDCRETARLSSAEIGQGGELRTVHGPQAFAARLDQAGLAIVRVTGADVAALAELRSEENVARETAQNYHEAYRPHHFAEGLSAGDIAAVTRRGDVYQLNSHRLDIEAIAASLESAGAGKDESLPSVTEARVAFLIERNATAALGDEARDEAREARIEHSAEWDADLETARTIEEAERDMRDVTEATEDMVDGAAAGIGRGVEKVLGAAFDAAANFIAPPPPPTKEQVKVMRQEAEFRADLAAWAAEQAAQSNQQDDARRKQRAAEREAEEEERRRWQDRERERERDQRDQ